MTEKEAGAVSDITDEVELEIRGHQRIMRLNRPERLNAVNQKLTDAMRAVLAVVELDQALLAVVLAGRGRMFCAGMAKAVAQNAPLAMRSALVLAREAAAVAEAELWNADDRMCKVIDASEDAQEGARAFCEKRAPVTTGR